MYLLKFLLDKFPLCVYIILNKTFFLICYLFDFGYDFNSNKNFQLFISENIKNTNNSDNTSSSNNLNSNSLTDIDLQLTDRQTF
jgi:hypothetical protein